MSQIIGHISQVIGPVVDVYFEGTESDLILPSIHDALEIKRHNGKKLIVEVQQHIGENTVRTVAMDSTDGLQRGMKVFPTGGPITMPVGEQIKGRLMNVPRRVEDEMYSHLEGHSEPIYRHLQAGEEEDVYPAGYSSRRTGTTHEASRQYASV